jgi:hypothetical protein
LQVIGISSAFVAIWLGLGLLLFCLFALEKLLRLDLRAIMIGIDVGAAMALAVYGFATARNSELAKPEATQTRNLRQNQR